MKWIDLPPVWLAGFAACVWFTPIVDPFLPAQSWIGGALIGVGVVMMCLAVIEMYRHRTTVIPHLKATTLVTSGVFGLSRNPIYLGDAFVLAGLILLWQAHPALILLVPAFMYVIASRFIVSEEMRLKTGFGDDFTKYCDTTRRWL